MLDFVADTFHALTMDAFREQSRKVVVSRAKGLSIDEFTRILESEIIKLGEAWKKHHADGMAEKDTMIANLRAALCEHQLKSGTNQYHRLRGIEMNNRLLDDLERGLDKRVELYDERARLRAILTPIINHAAAHDYAPPIRMSVAACREMLEAINGKA